IRDRPVSVRRLTVIPFLLALVSLKFVAVFRVAAMPGGGASGTGPPISALTDAVADV
ncbi:MAG: hypothetical protein IH798_06395, partial [Gemmatimonadetes bacterium]|nr:hypothetical protein [Gemmatimonadota bacterium]